MTGSEHSPNCTGYTCANDCPVPVALPCPGCEDCDSSGKPCTCHNGPIRSCAYHGGFCSNCGMRQDVLVHGPCELVENHDLGRGFCETNRCHQYRTFCKICDLLVWPDEHGVVKHKYNGHA